MQWNSAPSANQDDLARFVIDQSDAPVCIELFNRAKAELPALSQDPYFDGYASGDPERVHIQVEAIYRALHAHKPELVYTNEPQNRFVKPLNQIVRSVSECVSTLDADCIDITSTCASLLLRAGLNPIVAVVGPAQSKTPTHAILGYWMEEKTGPNVKLSWASVKANLSEIAFLEGTCVLVGNKKPFSSACAESMMSLPREDRGAIPLRYDAQQYAAQYSSSPDAQVFYLIDVRRMLADLTSAIPVIAVVGTKGGVGKTTVTARIAELIAEAKKNVLVIDLDLETALGSTRFHQHRAAVPLQPVKTVYDHLLPYSKDHRKGSEETDDEKKRADETDDSLWDVTPRYLQQRKLGKIFMIPARPWDKTDGWDMVAGVVGHDKKIGNLKLYKRVEHIIQRAKTSDHEIHCVLIDCGAGLNPIFAAAVHRSRYAFIVTEPDKDAPTSMELQRQRLVQCFPKANTLKLHVVVNKIEKEKQEDVLTEEGWGNFRVAGLITKDPNFQAAYHRNAVYFDLGYDDFSFAVRNVLAHTLHGMDETLLPDEVDIWIRPWWNQIHERQVIKHLQRSWRFRLATALSRTLASVCILAAVVFGFFAFRPNTLGPEPQEIIQGDAKQVIDYEIVMLRGAWVLSLIAAGVSIVWLLIQEKRRKLLVEVMTEGKKKEYVSSLLKRSRERGTKITMRWLRDLLDKSVQQEREVEERRRSGVVRQRK